MMLANLVCSLIKHRRVTTTLAKAKAARSVAEKMLTLGKRGTIHDRRLAAARLHQEDAVRILFNEIAPTQMERHGGYTRIVKLHERKGDAAQLAILEWVEESVSIADKREETIASEPAESPGKTKQTKVPSSADSKSAEEGESSQSQPEISSAQSDSSAEGESSDESPEDQATKKD